MGIVAGLFLIFVIIIAFVFIGNQLTTFAQDIGNSLGEGIRNNESKIPAPKAGTTIYDLVITVSPKWAYSITDGFLTPDNILFLNQEGGKISRTWQNPHKAGSFPMSLLSIADLIKRDVEGLPKNEIVIPAPNVFGSTVTLSYVLVDPDTNLKKELPHYQDIKYKIPSGVGVYVLNEKLVFRDVEKKTYELWIIPTSAQTRWADHAEGEAYKQIITG
jgi:hypothetical protein